jgi:hypothetical protein
MSQSSLLVPDCLKPQSHHPCILLMSRSTCRSVTSESKAPERSKAEVPTVVGEIYLGLALCYMTR